MRAEKAEQYLSAFPAFSSFSAFSQHTLTFKKLKPSSLPRRRLFGYTIKITNNTLATLALNFQPSTINKKQTTNSLHPKS
jgi:hypothetical protein